MSSEFVSSDASILDLLRMQDTVTVAELATELDVTATAVRQRLTRLMAQGFVRRQVERTGRGRPSHRYELTGKGRRKAGANFADLASVMWEELRSIEHPEVRRGLLQRLGKRLGQKYSRQLTGTTGQQRMEGLAALFEDRMIPMEVKGNTLNVLACPYPELAEQDRGVCAMESQMFTEVLGQDVRLSGCRLDGESCCRFEVKEQD